MLGRRQLWHTVNRFAAARGIGLRAEICLLCLPDQFRKQERETCHHDDNDSRANKQQAQSSLVEPREPPHAASVSVIAAMYSRPWANCRRVGLLAKLAVSCFPSISQKSQGPGRFPPPHGTGDASTDAARYDCRRKRNQGSISVVWPAPPILGPVIQGGAAGTSSMTPTLRAQVVNVLCAASTDFRPSYAE